MTKYIRPPVKWYGGKRYLADWIISYFPPHRIYIEPFGGAASVLLNKPPVEVETYNDLDLRITRLFQVLRNQGEAFVKRVSLIPYSKVEFDNSLVPKKGMTDLDKAILDFVRWRQSFAGKGQHWSFTTGRARGGMAGDVNAWWTAIEGMPAVIDRLRRVQILCEPAIYVINKFDHKEAVIYCDPPYLHETREQGSREVYGIEMTEDDHIMLSNTLKCCQAKVILSGYRSDKYDELYKNWRRVEKDIANHAAGGKSKARQTECLWMNF